MLRDISCDVIVYISKNNSKFIALHSEKKKRYPSRSMKTQAGSSRVAMCSKKHTHKQSETSRLKVVSKSLKNKNSVSKHFDSDVDIHIEKSPKSPIVKKMSINANTSIGSPNYEKGNLDVIKICSIFEKSKKRFFKKYVWVIHFKKTFLIDVMLFFFYLCKLFFSAILNESRCTRSHVQEKSNVTISQFCSMINTSIRNNEDLDKVSRVMSPKKHQEKPSDTSISKSPKQKNISISSKQKRQNDTSKLPYELVSMSPKKKKTVPEQSDSDIDIHIQKKNPNLKKTNQSCKSPIVKSKSITSDIHEEGNFFIIIVFKYGNRLNVKSCLNLFDFI